MTRALIYCRISSDPQGKRAGVERQMHDCRELANKLGWTVLEGVLEPDNDISAYSGKARPQYRKLLTELQAGRADAVIVWHPDRLYRRLSELEEFIDVVSQHEIAVRTVTAGELDLTTPTGRAMARTAAVWAGHEVEHGIERMNAAKLDAAMKGKYRGGSRPFGFESDGITIRKPEAEAIREATDRVLAGVETRDIATDWRKAGLATAKGGAWQPKAVRQILIRARNAGLIERHGEIVGPAQWEAIVSESHWRGVRAKLMDPSRSTTRTRDRQWLGSGLFFCHCGARVRIGTRGGHEPTYRCKRSDHLARKAAPVDDHISKVMLAYLSREDVTPHLHSTVDVTALQSEANAIRERLDELRRALGSRDIDLRTYKIASEGMEADLAAVEAQLQASAARSPLTGVADAEDVERAWDAAGLPGQRAIIATLVTVTLLPGNRGRIGGGDYFDPDTVDIRPEMG